MIRQLRARQSPAPLPAEALEFQNDLDALLAEPVPLLLRIWPVLAGGLLLSLVIAAAVLRIDVVVTASGRLMADEPPVVLQPMGSAVLRELHVKPGQSVTAGEVLAVLDSTFTAADRETLEAQQRALLARRARLDAELAGETGFTAGADAEAALQKRLMARRADFLAARRAAFDTDLRALEAARRAEEETSAGLEAQLALAREVEGMRAKLLRDNVGSRLDLLLAESARLDTEQRLHDHRARIEELGHQQVSKRAEMDAFLRDWDRQSLEELAAIGPELERIAEQLSKAARLDALTLLRAPRDGVVLEIAKRAPGSVVREGDAVVTLVPSNVPLIAEIRLKSADIGRLHAGDPAVLKIDSFPWRRYGSLPGTLRSISRESYPASETVPTSTALHRGQILLDPEAVAAHRDEMPLIPGMTLSAEVKTGERTVLEFFLEPILRGLRESLREP
ncbi:MAG: HlyD family type I secretion periplasmic adaptor subunit [Rhodobacteraceae bacterium]|nr:HlyD family type I secretion periplasmic adaptor subunit [Paracoccaceae bacterium]